MDFFSPAQILGYVAFIFGVASFLQKSDKKLILFNASACIVYTVHFFLLGNPTASGSAFVSAVRSGIALKYKAHFLAWIFIALNIAIGAFAAKSWTGWFPVLGCCFATLGLFYMRGVGLRLMFLTSTALWLGNNILSGSIGGTALEFSIFVTNATTIVRMLLKERASAAAERYGTDGAESVPGE
jgi:hypothetical protein